MYTGIPRIAKPLLIEEEISVNRGSRSLKKHARALFAVDATRFGIAVGFFP